MSQKSQKTKIHTIEEHQDWENYIVHCKNPTNKLNGKDNSNMVVKNKIKTVNNDKKLEDQIEKGELKHKKINTDLKIEFQKWRQSKGYTQKQVAIRLNVTQSIINDFESGKLNHNPKLVSNIKRMIKN